MKDFSTLQLTFNKDSPPHTLGCSMLDRHPKSVRQLEEVFAPLPCSNCPRLMLDNPGNAPAKFSDMTALISRGMLTIVNH